MPFVLKHRESGQIYTCLLTNHYKLHYYGTKYWDDEQAAFEETHSFLAEQEVQDPDNWNILEIEEQKMKIFNVKLKNDPSLALYVNELIQPEIRSKSSI